MNTRETQIEKARRLIATGISEDFKEVLYQQYPELRDSEDERIRQTLIDMVKRETGFTGFPSQGQVLAYLEKKKEQKPAEWSEEDEQAAKEIRAMFNRGTFLCPDVQFLSNWLVSVKDRITRHHWKPSEEQMGALKNARYMMSQSGYYYDTVQILDSLINDLEKL